MATTRSGCVPDRESRRLATPHLAGTGFSALQDVQEFIEIAVRCSSSVLISGGDLRVRSMLARCIHQESARQDGPFVVVDYRGSPDAWLTSSLGSLFLEDIHALSPEAQAHVLDLLTGRPLGQTHMRVMAGAAHDLPNAVRAGNFSADLFHRLSALHMIIG